MVSGLPPQRATWRDLLSVHLDSLPDGARDMVAWQIEAAEEMAKAHHVLDLADAPRTNPETGNHYTLAARIANAL